MKKIIYYLITIIIHKYYVFKFSIYFKIPLLGFLHDRSKLSYLEWIKQSKYYDGKSSPITNEKKVLGFSKAWLNHKGRNKHHVEYWIDINNGELISIRPDWKYFKEMLVDWYSATLTYSHDKKFHYNNFLNYWNSRKDKNFMHPSIIKVMSFYLNMFDENSKLSAKECIKLFMFNEKEMKKLYENSYQNTYKINYEQPIRFDIKNKTS